MDTTSRPKKIKFHGHAWRELETDVIVLAWEKAARAAPELSLKTLMPQVHTQYLQDLYDLAHTNYAALNQPPPSFEAFIQRDPRHFDGGLEVTDAAFQPRSAASIETQLRMVFDTYSLLKESDAHRQPDEPSWFDLPIQERPPPFSQRGVSVKVLEIMHQMRGPPQGPRTPSPSTTAKPRVSTATASSGPIHTMNNGVRASSPSSASCSTRSENTRTTVTQPLPQTIGRPRERDEASSSSRHTRRRPGADLNSLPSRRVEPSELPRHAAAIWVDNANITRTRVVPTRRLEADPEFCITLTNAVQGRAAMGDTPFEPPVGEVYLVPEKTRTLYNINRWMSGTGAFFGDMRQDHDTTEWMHCPRSFLHRQLVKLFTDYSIVPTLGFELEFQILEAETLVPIDSALYCSMKAFHDGRAWTLLKEIVECLEDDLHIPLHQYHPESASGQLEISTGRFDVEEYEECYIAAAAIVRAVDKLVLARQTIYAMAAQRGFQATFLPKLATGQAGNAAHMHIGLVDVNTNRNMFDVDTTPTKAFLAGVLEELPSLCMLLAPTVNSYDRLQPRCWAGAYQCYGYENREAPLRLVGPPSARENVKHVDHFEVKTLDGTANPYLALGAILAAGMSGIQQELELPPPCNQDPAIIEASQRPALLPRSLDEAIERFQSRREALWDTVLSESYASLLVTLREAELAHYSILSQSDQIKELLKRY